MSVRVEITPDALHDIDEICAYISENDGPARAYDVGERIFSLAATLGDNPERGNLVREVTGRLEGMYREVHFKPYRLIYSIEKHVVLVAIVADGRRDMRSLLARRLP